LLPLLNQDRDKVLAGFDLDTFPPAQMQFKDMLLVGGLRVRERKTRKFARQLRASHAVEAVDS
jgi:hypothetical protein